MPHLSLFLLTKARRLLKIGYLSIAGTCKRNVSTLNVIQISRLFYFYDRVCGHAAMHAYDFELLYW